MMTDPRSGDIRVIVTFQALEGSIVSSVVSVTDAFRRFDAIRDRVETAASAKYDRIADSIQEYEGVKTFLIITGDPM